jgi:acyl-coenzyme A thioesterase PaaI-like protein
VTNAEGGWQQYMRRPGEDVDAWGALVERFRVLADAVAAANLPLDVMRDVATAHDAVGELVAKHTASERERYAGRCMELPGRGHPFLVPFLADETTPTSVRGRVTFGSFYLGGNTAAHGGTQPLLFDDLLGIMVTRSSNVRVRTASLTVNYRRIAPVGQELVAEATVDKVDGRKTWATGRLWHGDVLLADASALFLALRDDQP